MGLKLPSHPYICMPDFTIVYVARDFPPWLAHTFVQRATMRQWTDEPLIAGCKDYDRKCAHWTVDEASKCVFARYGEHLIAIGVARRIMCDEDSIDGWLTVLYTNRFVHREDPNTCGIDLTPTDAAADYLSRLGEPKAAAVVRACAASGDLVVYADVPVSEVKCFRDVLEWELERRLAATGLVPVEEPARTYAAGVRAVLLGLLPDVLAELALDYV